MTDEPKFAPFLPSPPTSPEQPAATKKTRKPRAIPTVDKFSVAAVADFTAPALAAAKKTRKPRAPKAEPAKRSPKFDLQTILSVASQLKDGDMKMFEKVLGQLQDLPKSSRARVLAALEKVFA